ncbi:MAG: CotS family spore coat protein [Peptococcaceae bacterium]|nr:CotS family spore coat protein [Peptococcaceae bacterium]
MFWQEELWQVLTEDFHLKPRLLEQYDTVYRLYTAEGTYAIKEIKYPEEEFAYIFAATEHLRSNGFSHINYMLLNEAGKASFQLGEKRYFIAPWLPGRQLDYTIKEDVTVAATTLAQMHGAAAGFLPPYYKGRIKWGELIENFRTKLAQMDGWRQAFTDTVFCQDYRAALDEMIGLGQEVVQSLVPVYGDFNRMEERWGGFCHHDYAPHNIVLSPDGVGQIIDFDYCISDTGCHDLASLMCRVLKKNEFQEDLAYGAWQEYQKERLLPKGAKEVSLAFMLFPQEFWQCGFTYFVEQNRPEAKMEKRLQGVLDASAAKNAAIRSLAKWL